MPEQSFPVKPVSVKYTCDNCGKGEMLPTGMAFSVYPAQYEHECNNCGYMQSFKVQYPLVRYEAIQKDETPESCWIARDPKQDFRVFGICVNDESPGCARQLSEWLRTGAELEKMSVVDGVKTFREATQS